MSSQDSQKSGIAASAISFGGESLRLSQFPPPPTEIPTTPLQSEFGTPTPTRTQFSLSDVPPATPKRSRQIAVPSIPQGGDGPRSRRMTSNKSSSQGSVTSRTASRHPLQASSVTSGNAISARGVSPYDWHEGASSVDMDPAEDRLLSTSFITSLLSSPELNDGSRSYSPISFRHGTFPPSNDVHSHLSDSSYPPPSSLFTGSTSSGYPLLPASHPRALPAQSQQQTRRPPPSAYPLARIEPTDSASRPSSADSVTLNSALGHDPVPATGYTAISRGVRVSGVTVVGSAPTKLRTLGDDEDGASHLHKFESGGDDVFSGLQTGRESTDRPGNSNSDSSHAGPSSMMFSPALPSTAGTHTRFPREHSKHRSVRESQYSTKTTKSYVSSFISRVSAVASGKSAFIKNTFSPRTIKPLPPIPTLPHLSVAAEMEGRRLEERLPMPHLVNRADTLAKMLEKGDYPHDRLDPTRQEKIGTDSWYKDDGTGAAAPYLTDPPLKGNRDSKPKRRRYLPTRGFFDTVHYRYKRSPSSKMRIIMGVGLIAVLLITVIAVAVGLTVTKRRSSHPSDCAGNLTGASCNLDATCLCTTFLPGQCGNLASGLISLIPTVNTLFMMNLTPASLSTAIWTTLGTPIGGNCAPQVLLVDVSPGLDPSTMPNRTLWAQSALLWNLVQSQDLTAVKKIRTFVSNAPWNRLGSADGPVPDAPSIFQISISGFIFDFAAQTVTQPNVTFVSDGQPTNAQIAQVSDTAQGALDRMYSYALASSSQRQSAWATYWRTILQQKPEDLPIFMSTIASSPILIPFNASYVFASGLLTNSTNAPFPPPVACYPALSPDQIHLVNTIEGTVFGLASLPNQANTRFDTACFPDRPLYGVLDILQLRLPFVDSRTGVARQAAVLKSDVSPRAIVYSGEILSTLPDTSGPPNITVSQTNPRQFGTLDHFDHVILNYFSSISDINVAKGLVSFVLSSSNIPPANTTLLFQSLSSLPMLEVAVFGTIDPSDISSSVSSFATTFGSLFFGSDAAAALRQWAISATSSSVVWTEFASSSQVVRDSSFTDPNFNSVWNPAFAYLHSDHPGITVGVGNITSAFQAVGKFSP